MGTGGDSAVAPGTCGIARRISVPVQLANANVSVAFPGSVAAPHRLGGGFVLGPWTDTSETGSRRLLWFSVEPAAQTQTLHATEFGFQGHVLTSFTVAATSRLVLVDDTGYDGYWTAVIDEGATVPSMVEKLVDGQFSKFTWVRGGISLDGQRALFMTAEIAGHAPWLAMYAADGARVGDVVQTTTEGDCYGVVPTERGAAFTLMEGATTFHVSEFSADGSVALDVKIPYPRTSLTPTACPNLVLTDTGFAYLGFVSRPDGDGWTIHRVARDGTVTLEPWDALLGCTAPALAVQGDTAIATCAQTNQTTIVKRVAGHDQRFPLERTGPPIPSEPGTLFVEISAPQSVGSPGTIAREILEIRCSD